MYCTRRVSRITLIRNAPNNNIGKTRTSLGLEAKDMHMATYA